MPAKFPSIAQMHGSIPRVAIFFGQTLLYSEPPIVVTCPPGCPYYFDCHFFNCSPIELKWHSSYWAHPSMWYMDLCRGGGMTSGHSLILIHNHKLVLIINSKTHAHSHTSTSSCAWACYFDSDKIWGTDTPMTAMPRWNIYWWTRYDTPTHPCIDLPNPLSG